MVDVRQQTVWGMWTRWADSGPVPLGLSRLVICCGIICTIFGNPQLARIYAAELLKLPLDVRIVVIIQFALVGAAVSPVFVAMMD